MLDFNNMTDCFIAAILVTISIWLVAEFLVSVLMRNVSFDRREFIKWWVENNRKDD